MTNPLLPFLERQGVLILDGGLATELEARGCDLDDELWSARLLMDDPELIRQVHLDYLRAGADCIVSASYQATREGFERCGSSRGQAVDLLRSSVRLAIETRDSFWEFPANRSGRVKPIVAASVGPYGAYLADGSEYRGDYDLERAELRRFHGDRWLVLAESGADLLACETIPSREEALALLALLHETPHVCAWFSFSCMDGERLNDGTRLTDVIEVLSEADQVVALGVNCTPPKFVPSLIARARDVTDKPIVVYPNSGETFEADGKRWLQSGMATPFGEASVAWRSLGASMIGGCCRTGPSDIGDIRGHLL
ncbi:MAG: homocysteine S-methyltransferase [Gemmatimonadales bacterium]